MCGSVELEVCVSAVLFDLVYSSQRKLNKLNTVPFRERASFEIRGLGRQQQVQAWNGDPTIGYPRCGPGRGGGRGWAALV